jgi:23S rRNA pseudouridine1911/1915/1917 synthase
VDLPPLDVLFTDNHLLVVRKPSGALVQGDDTGDPTLLDAGKAWLKEKFGKPGNVFLGLVHRLDRPVSGVVVFARTSKAAGRLSDQFRRGEVRKIYWALAEGKVPEAGAWEDRIAREGATSRTGTGGEGREAALRFRLLKFLDGVSWVEVEPGTGRHHQVRVQFASRGYPLLGDFRYGSKRKFPRRAVALHARTLTFAHPTRGEEMTFTAEPEDDWPAEFR